MNFELSPEEVEDCYFEGVLFQETFVEPLKRFKSPTEFDPGFLELTNNLLKHPYLLTYNFIGKFLVTVPTNCNYPVFGHDIQARIFTSAIQKYQSAELFTLGFKSAYNRMECGFSWQSWLKGIQDNRQYTYAEKMRMSDGEYLMMLRQFCKNFDLEYNYIPPVDKVAQDDELFVDMPSNSYDIVQNLTTPGPVFSQRPSDALASTIRSSNSHEGYLNTFGQMISFEISAGSNMFDLPMMIRKYMTFIGSVRVEHGYSDDLWPMTLMTFHHLSEYLAYLSFALIRLIARSDGSTTSRTTMFQGCSSDDYNDFLGATELATVFATGVTRNTASLINNYLATLNVVSSAYGQPVIEPQMIFGMIGYELFEITNRVELIGIQNNQLKMMRRASLYNCAGLDIYTPDLSTGRTYSNRITNQHRLEYDQTVCVLINHGSLNSIYGGYAPGYTAINLGDMLFTILNDRISTDANDGFEIGIDMRGVWRTEKFLERPQDTSIFASYRDADQMLIAGVINNAYFNGGLTNSRNKRSGSLFKRKYRQLTCQHEYMDRRLSILYGSAYYDYSLGEMYSLLMQKRLQAFHEASDLVKECYKLLASRYYPYSRWNAFYSIFWLLEANPSAAQ